MSTCVSVQLQILRTHTTEKQNKVPALKELVFYCIFVWVCVWGGWGSGTEKYFRCRVLRRKTKWYKRNREQKCMWYYDTRCWLTLEQRPAWSRGAALQVRGKASQVCWRVLGGCSWGRSPVSVRNGGRRDQRGREGDCMRNKAMRQESLELSEPKSDQYHLIHV